jgi:hypothetical protein
MTLALASGQLEVLLSAAAAGGRSGKRMDESVSVPVGWKVAMVNDSDSSFVWPDHRCRLAWRAHLRDELAYELVLEHSKLLWGCWRAAYLYELKSKMQAAVRRLDEDALAEVLGEVLALAEEL